MKRTKKWGDVAGTRGKKSSRRGWAGRVEGRMENTLKLQVRDASAAIRLKLPSGTLQLGAGFVSHL